MSFFSARYVNSVEICINRANLYDFDMRSSEGIHDVILAVGVYNLGAVILKRPK